MYESMNQPIPDVSKYLERIGMRGPVELSLEGLNALIYNHQTHVPFEDLDSCALKRPVALDIPALYDKVVAKRRGGYCYELNALFQRLLLDLGFDARGIFCRVVRGRDFIPPCAHRAIAVTLGDRMYFCDVGFGGPMPAGALPIGDGVGEVIHGEPFRVRRYDDYWWTLSRTASDGAEEDVLQFNTFPQTPQEFIAANMKASLDPDSIFTWKRLVNLRTDNGSKDITQDTFTLRRGGEVAVEKIADDAQLKAILDAHFGIRID